LAQRMDSLCCCLAAANYDEVLRHKVIVSLFFHGTGE
jgi:hypothetical protein